ncbi:Translation initiation factor eIF-2B subunit gamma [Savitreella phatthalungensis]
MASSTGRRTVASDLMGIVLCGPGNNLGPLARQENMPKALLPIGNRPLIEAPLQMLEDAGITTVFLLCLGGWHESALNTWVKSSCKSSSRPLVVATSEEDDLAGSADALRFLLRHDKYRARLNAQSTMSCVIVSCDARCDVPLYKILDSHRESGTHLTSVCYDPRNGPDPSAKKRDGGSLLAYAKDVDVSDAKAVPGHPRHPRLLLAEALADIDDDQLQLRTSMLWQYGKLEVSTTLRQLHLYICSRTILDVIEREDAISRFDADFVTLACKAQTQPALRKRYSLPEDILCSMYLVNTTGARLLSKPAAHGRVVVQRDTQSQFQHGCMRVNTIRAYAEAQKDVLKHSSQDPRVPITFIVAERSTVGQDCLAAVETFGETNIQEVLADGSVVTPAGAAPTGSVDEKSTVKRSCLGFGVRIGKGCKITGCTFMDGVTVLDGAKLENSIVCAGAVVGERASLKDCIVGGRHRVPDRIDKKGEELFEGGEISLQ